MPSISKSTSEMVIFHRFKDAYKNKTGTVLDNVLKTEEPKAPDFRAIDKFTGASIGIEITGVYQSPEEAKIQHWRQEGWEGFFSGNQDHIIQEFNRVISKKAKRSFEYEFDDKLILVIYLGSIVFNEQIDLEFMQPSIIIPPNNFAEIWVIIRDKITDYDLFRLS